MLKISKSYDDNNIIYFDDDAEFVRFAINPELSAYQYTNQNGETCYGTKYDFSDSYKKAIADGQYFYINDSNSRINKNGDFGYKGMAAQKVENLKSY